MHHLPLLFPPHMLPSPLLPSQYTILLLTNFPKTTIDCGRLLLCPFSEATLSMASLIAPSNLHLKPLKSCPPLRVETIEKKSNPEYATWNQQDQLILSALTSSLTESIITCVLKCTTSRDLWFTLEHLFTSHS
jgi:hypothetical protein